MNIQLTNWQVKNLIFSITENLEVIDKHFNLEIANYFLENKDDEFAITIKVNIIDVMFDLKIESVFIFKLDDKITDDFKLSDFPKINAPAIAFPYLRAFISNLTLQAGVTPVILPSINFVELQNKETK